MITESSTKRCQVWRKANPLKTVYYNLKHNAKRRNKEFILSFEEFKKFAIECNLINRGGRSKKSFHIDRIDESKGYFIGNIQMITNEENIKKYYENSHYNTIIQNKEIEAPF